MSLAILIASMLNQTGAQLFDEHGLVMHALDLEDAMRRKRPDLQRLMFECLYGAKLPAVRFALGAGAVAAEEPALVDFRQMLECIVSHRKAAPAAFLKDWASALPGVRLVPVEIRRDGRLGFRLYADNLRAVLAYVAGLLLQEEFAPSLGRCHLEDCGRFFLAPVSSKGGRRQIRYCSKAHRDEFHARTASERVIRSRRNKARRAK